MRQDSVALLQRKLSIATGMCPLRFARHNDCRGGGTDFWTGPWSHCHCLHWVGSVSEAHGCFETCQICPYLRSIDTYLARFESCCDGRILTQVTSLNTAHGGMALSSACASTFRPLIHHSGPHVLPRRPRAKRFFDLGLILSANSRPRRTLASTSLLSDRTHQREPRLPGVVGAPLVRKCCRTLTER